MYKTQAKAIPLLFLILVSGLVVPMFAPVAIAQGETKVKRITLKYGYWEVAPVIENVLTDFTVEHLGNVYALGDVRSDQDLIAGKYNTMDVDGNAKGATENFVGVVETTEEVVEEVPPELQDLLGEEIVKVVPRDPADIQADYDNLDALMMLADEATPSYHWYKTISGSDMASASMGSPDPDVSYKKTYIWSSAPEVAFSVGQVYLSDAYGTHWAGLGYENTSQAAESLSNTVTMTNTIQNATYIYREIPYSFRVVFWTMGDCEVSHAMGSHKIYSYEEEDVILGFGQSSYTEKDSYSIQYSWVDKAWADIDEVEANLKINIETPLFTSRATQEIHSPDGTVTFYYNDTWIGIMDASVQNIIGGAIDTRVPISPAYPNGLPTGTVSSEIPTSVARSGLPDQENYVIGTHTQTIQPGLDAEAVLEGDEDGYVHTSSSGDFGDGTPDSVYRDIQDNPYGYNPPGGAITDIDMTDPEHWEPYQVATTQAMGASLAHPQYEYIVSWNDSSEYDPNTGELYPFDYEDGKGKWINSQIISEVSSDQINRVYSPQLELDREIPNSMTLSLGARLKPALHISTTKHTIEQQRWRREYMIFFGWQDAGLESRNNYNFETISSVEILNVFCTYTVTFTVMMIDKYNNDVPLTNIYAQDSINPYIQKPLHNDTYDKQYDYQSEHFLWYNSIFTWIIMAIVGVIVVIVVLMVIKKMRGGGGGKAEVKIEQYFGEGVSQSKIGQGQSSKEPKGGH
jgi:hypothetical protein